LDLERIGTFVIAARNEAAATLPFFNFRIGLFDYAHALHFYPHKMTRAQTFY
jgi:hypothetical protein